jgi:hypothetical protein
MAKRTRKKQRPRAADHLHHHRSHHAASRPLTVPLGVPLYWTPEEAFAVYELIDDLRDLIAAIYQNRLQDLTRRQRQSGPIDHIHMDDDDLPF